jgi:hypothetical protein
MRGQGLPEMLIVFPLAVILLMSIVQLALLYRAKATLNNATFLAARSGSLHNGFVEPMQEVFHQRMAALGKIEPGKKGGSTTVGFYANPTDASLQRVREETAAWHDYDVVEVLFPTRAVFNYFAIAVNELVPCSGSDCPGGGGFQLSSQSVLQIPNNNLDARNRDNHLIADNNVTLQDANLLSIKSRFCYAMEVPVANFIIWRTYGSLFANDAEWRLCQSLFEGEHTIPLVGHTVVRMQSPFRCEGDEEEGINCENI